MPTGPKLVSKTVPGISLRNTRPVKVGILAASLSAQEFMERRVGGILKGLGVVGNKFLIQEDVAAQIQQIEARADCELVVCYAGGVVTSTLLKDRLRSQKILEVQLAILPVGIKMLYSIPAMARIGVVARHLSCANLLLSEILRAGLVNRRFLSGTVQETPRMDLDYVIAAEEMGSEALDVLSGMRGGKTPRFIQLPRNLAFQSVGRLIAATQALAGSV